MILVGTIDVARVFYAAITVDDASRAGAQYGIRSNGFTSDISGMEGASAHNAQDLGTVTTTPERYCRCEGGSTDVNCVTGTCTEGVPQVYVRVETQKHLQHRVHLSRDAQRHPTLECDNFPRAVRRTKKMNPRNEGAGNPVRGNHRRRKERGSVLVEFVLSFPAVFLGHPGGHHGPRSGRFGLTMSWPTPPTKQPALPSSAAPTACLRRPRMTLLRLLCARGSTFLDSE